MTARTRFGTALLALACAIAVGLAAAGEAVPYMSGGVGKDERQQLLQAAEGYNLKLVFHTKTEGAYLSHVKVSIRDPEGRLILRTVSEGPWFFVRLPPGSYDVSAEARGILIGRLIGAPAQGQLQVNYCWPD